MTQTVKNGQTDRQPGNEPDWAALRQEFPTTEGYAYLALANKALLPRRVEAAMQEWLGDIFQNAGETAFSMTPIEETRETVARVFGAPAACLSLIKNTSEGINIVANGVGFEPGDNVVISEFEHENNTFPWRYLERRGVEVRMVPSAADGTVPVLAYEPYVDAKTRVVAAAWVSYGNGFRQDIRALADFCHAHDALLVVDGIQAVGILADPIASLGADVVIAGGHKAQFGLAGAGFMYMQKALIHEISPPYAAKFSFTSNDRFQDDPVLAEDGHRFEYGNPNFLGVWVQRRSAEFVESVGLENIEARVRHLTDYVIEQADARGITVRTPRDWKDRAGIVSLDLGVDHEALVARLQEKKVIVSFKDGYVRVSLHFYNNEADIDRFFDVALG